MPTCFFASDLHGDTQRYDALLRLIDEEMPSAVFLGGDLLPSGFAAGCGQGYDHADFINGYLVQRWARLRDKLGARYPRVFLILGNDDFRSEEATFQAAAETGVWEYMHDRRVAFGGFDVFGYACVPPSPFQQKDWERYDVSRSVPPGCVSPEEGCRSVPVASHRIRYATIREDLAKLAAGDR